MLCTLATSICSRFTVNSARVVRTLTVSVPVRASGLRHHFREDMMGIDQTGRACGRASLRYGVVVFVL